MSSSSGYSDSVKVCLRVRPLIGYERTVGCQQIITYPQQNQLVVNTQNTSSQFNQSNINSQTNQIPFTFDFVFNEAVAQTTVYEQCVEPLLKAFVDGYNATILAYGRCHIQVNYHVILKIVARIA